MPYSDLAYVQLNFGPTFYSQVDPKLVFSFINQLQTSRDDLGPCKNKAYLDFSSASGEFQGSKSAKILFDTGAQLDVFSLDLATKWGLKIDSSEKKLLKAFNGQRSYTVGTIKLILAIGAEQIPISFDVIKSSSPTVILSHATLAGLGVKMEKGIFYAENGEVVGRDTQYLTDSSGSCVIKKHLVHLSSLAFQ